MDLGKWLGVIVKRMLTHLVHLELRKFREIDREKANQVSIKLGADT